MDGTGAAVEPFRVGGRLRLEPFRAVMLAPHLVGDPASGRLFAKPYRGVPQRVRAWRERGLLQQDAAAAVYLHEYTSEGTTIRGLIGVLDLEPDSREQAIYPHEGVHPGQVAELADRLHAMAIDPAPILLVQHGSTTLRALLDRVSAEPAPRQYFDHVGQQHRIWPLTQPTDLDLVGQELAASRAVLADGHHRLAAYLRNHARGRGDGSRAGLAMVIDQDATALQLRAIHRVLAGAGVGYLQRAASALGCVTQPLAAGTGWSAVRPDTLVVTDGTDWLSVQVGRLGDRAIVEFLHDDLLRHAAVPAERVGFHHVPEQALASLALQPGVAVFLPAPDLDLVLRVVASGRLLPEKATSFQPKPSTGALLRLVGD